MDLPKSPNLRLIRINGKLTFKDDIDIEFSAKHIFIRAGELHIGSKDKPFEKNCKIILTGEKNQKAIVYDNAIEAGNKLIANINIMNIFGKKRQQTLTRLQAPALKGDTSITVEAGLDFVKGDRLGLLPTSTENRASDDVIVEEYDTTTGVVKIDRARPPNEIDEPGLNWYHWGAAESTEKEYGVDMRGEVVLLTRNVKIVGEDVESWGG